MFGAVIGALRVTLGLNAGEFRKGSKSAVRQLGDLDRALKRVALTGAGFAAAASAAAAALTAKLAASSLETIDVQAKLARRLGATTSGFQATQRAAELAGLTQDMVAKAAENLNVRLGEASRKGIGPAAEALDRLGLSADDLISMDIDARLALFAQRFQELNLSAAAQSDILRDLGIRNRELINLFEDGGDSIHAARSEIEAFGVAVSDVDARKIEMANDAMSSIQFTLKGIGNQVAIQVAPFIKAIADQFANAAKESHGFSGAIASALGTAVEVVGFFLDEIHKSRIDWDLLVAQILNGANAIIRAVDKITQKYSLGIIPAIGQIEHDYGKLAAKLSEPLPSDELRAWVEEVKARAQEAAEALANSGAGGLPGLPGDPGPTDRERDELERERARQEAKLEQLRAALMTEREAELADYELRLADLLTFEERKMLTIAEAQGLRERVEQEHQENMAAIARAGAQQVARSYTDMGNRVGNLISSLTNVIGGESDKQFGILKAASIATALLKSYEAITSSYAAGAAIGGPPIGTAYAAIAAATTAAQVAAIAGLGPGSSGSPSVAGGGGSVAPVAATPAADPQQGIFIEGINPTDLFSGQTVLDLIDSINDKVADGAVLVTG